MATNKMILNNHDCRYCVYHQETLDTKEIEPEDLENYRKIESKLDGLNRLIDEGAKDKTANPENQVIFFEEALKHQRELMDESIKWWNYARRKYGIDDSAVTRVDPERRKFCRCYDNSGKIYPAAEFVAK